MAEQKQEEGCLSMSAGILLFIVMGIVVGKMAFDAAKDYDALKDCVKALEDR